MDPYRRQKWIKAIKRAKWQPGKYDRLCSDHFSVGDYVDVRKGILRRDAIPHVFNISNHRQTKNKLSYQLQHSNNSLSPASSISTIPFTRESTPDTQPAIEFVSSSTQTNISMEDMDMYDDIIKEKISLSKKLNCERVKSCKLRKKVMKLDDVLKDLQNANLIDDKMSKLIEESFSGTRLDLWMNEKFNFKRPPSQRRYTNAIKQFALTIAFNSSAAYRHLRSYLTLPHEKTLRCYLCSIDGKPGFTSTSLSIIRKKIDSSQIESECTLIVDSMSIRKQQVYDNSKGQFVGFVNLGVESEDPRLAGDALVLFVVGLKTKWKYPIGYFLVDGINGDQQMNLIQHGICLLYENKAEVKALVMDGCYANQRTAQLFGVKFQIEDFNSVFLHPITSQPIYFILDVCHMIKLMRNLLAEYKVLIDPDGGKIRWAYIELLHEIQQSEGLTLANRLRATHINWLRKKMNVKLAVQTLSSSVAKSLDFMRTVIKDPRFADSQPTALFISKVDRLFDHLNASKLSSKGFKAPISANNISLKERDCNSIVKYLQNLKTQEEKPLIFTKRKTPILGFTTAVKSLFPLARDLLGNFGKKYKYFLPYNCSQDHLEIFFSVIRRRGGWNNNPNVVQFCAAYRGVLGTEGIALVNHSQSANCIPQEEAGDDTTDICSRDLPDLSTVGINIVAYIAGFVVRSVMQKLTCSDCESHLLINGNDDNDFSYQLIRIRNNGGLIYPSKEVITLCKQTEIFIRSMSPTELLNTRLKAVITSSVLRNGPVFPVDHAPGLDCHAIQLAKSIIHEYIKVVLHYRAKTATLKAVGSSIRSQNTKLILFKHQ